MLYFVLILLFILGYSVVQLVAKEISALEKAGMSLLIGIGILTICMFIFTLVGVPITQLSVLVTICMMIIGLNVPSIINKTFRQPAFKPVDKINITFTWFFFVGLIVYLFYGIAAKGLYWPTSEYDSMTGYDLMAKMIAKEGTLRTSIFSYPYQSTYHIARFIYPPLTAGCFAIPYLFGSDSSKIMMIILFGSFLLAFYGLLRKSVKDTWAIFFTFLMMITPEMFSHVSLSLTNLPNAIYTSLALICLIYWLRERSKSYFILSLILLILSNWSRSDSIVFAAGCGLVLLLDAFQTKKWLNTVIYACLSLVPFIAWSLFIKLNVGANSSDFFVKELFWDSEKFTTIFGKCLTLILGNGMYYGITFYAFIVILALNTVDIFQKRDALVILILSTWLMYSLLYYQMDYSFAGSVDAYINASYKRGMFNFVPLCWFFVATSPFSQRMLAKVEKALM